jgi:hypothetical protein
MKPEEKTYLKKKARSALQEGALSLAKDACKDEIDRTMPAEMRKNLFIVETDKLCFYVEKNKKLDAALESIASALKSTGKTAEQIRQEFRESRKRKTS